MNGGIIEPKMEMYNVPFSLLGVWGVVLLYAVYLTTFFYLTVFYYHSIIHAKEKKNPIKHPYFLFRQL